MGGLKTCFSHRFNRYSTAQNTKKKTQIVSGMTNPALSQSDFEFDRTEILKSMLEEDKNVRTPGFAKDINTA